MANPPTHVNEWRERARCYAYYPFLELDDMIVLVQGDWSHPHGTPPILLSEFVFEIQRLRNDIARGVLPNPCKPMELIKWARSVDVELADGFGGPRRQDEDGPAQMSPAPLAVRQRVPPREQSEDRIHVRNLAEAIWRARAECTLDEVVFNDRLKAYRTKYTGHNTLHDWIRDLNPNKGQRGRRRKRIDA